MNLQTKRIIEAVSKLAATKDVDPDVAVLCQAVLFLFRQTGHLHSDDLDAFEQIEELDRRQGPGDH
jgi:hypothetical protein